MIEGNLLTIVLVLVFFLMWKLELVATLLNLRAFPTDVPDELKNILDQEKLSKARDYQRANASFEIFQSVFVLMLLLTFWLVGEIGRAHV